MKLTINRVYQDDCTLGVLNYYGFRCFTLELPWKDNKSNVSCIPAGTYKCQKIVSPSLGECINVADVTGRTYIRIHKGNYTNQIQGCVLVGDSIRDINGDGIPDVTNSTATLEKLMALAPDEFEMVIS